MLDGGGGSFSFLPFYYFQKVIVSLPNPIWVSIIVEYSTTLMLTYFQDTLAYVGLPEGSLEWDSNEFNLTENKYLHRELNLIVKTRLNKVWNGESNQVVNSKLNQVINGGQNETANDNDGACIR